MQEKLDLKNQNALRKRLNELENSGLKTNMERNNLIMSLTEQMKIKKAEFERQEAILIQENNNLLTSFKDFEKKINDVSFQSRSK